MKNLKKFSSLLFLLPILLLAAFLRLYRIADYLTFLGDEGRDVLIVKHLLEGDLVGLGPTASVGGFFTGPIYYYFMAPFLWLFHLDPVGPAVMVALFGIATVFLVYLVGKEFFNQKAGIIAAALYAVSPLVLAYSRSSWNPNLMPFFTLLTVYTLYHAVKKQSLKLFFVSGIFFGIMLQLHYIELFFAVSTIAYLFFLGRKKFTRLLQTYAAMLGGFLLGMAPFLAFEITHGFPNTKSVVSFIFGGSGDTGVFNTKFFSIISDVLFRLFGRLITRFPPPEQVSSRIEQGGADLIHLWQLATWLLIIGALVSLFFVFKKATTAKKEYRHYLLLTFWLVGGIVFFGFYKKPIYDYYFEFMFPLPFLLLGNALTIPFTNKKIGQVVSIAGILIVIGLFLFNLDGMPFKHEPNRQLAQVRKISEFVLEKVEGKPFNFALITKQNSDHAYRYFFEIKGNAPVVIQFEGIDPQRNSVMDQLLVVCEDVTCQPEGHGLWEVAGFGKAEIVDSWDVSVVKVFKLKHYTGPL